VLTPDEQKYYDDLDEMFATEGWKNLIEDCTKEIYQLQADALEAGSWDEVCRLRGRAEQLAYLVNLEAVTETMKQQLIAERTAEETDPLL